MPATLTPALRLRPATAEDTPALLRLAVSTELFETGSLDPLSEVLANHHMGPSPYRLHVWSDEGAAEPVGVVYFGPNAMAENLWDLLWIAVAPERQGQGIGGDLIRLAERDAAADACRMIVIETGALPKFDATHAFYRAHGYTEVARIPDFYSDGDSKVIFSKRLIPAA
jgi:ribosomal protein S18 acetylase RimI-like enzyme